MPDDLYPPLTPVVAPWVHAVLADRAGLRRQFEQHGSPLNLHALQPFADNYAQYREVLERHGLRHLVFFARKANKCRAFVEEAERQGFGVDTASYRELEECLAVGCAPHRLVLTAAIKTERLVRLAVSHSVLIILDNLDECQLVESVAQDLGLSAQVGVRVSGFEVDGEKLYSRFGFPVEQVAPLIATRFGSGNEFPSLRYSGLHFHLNGYSRRQRGAALHATVGCADALSEHGIATAFIDIGGGLLVRYLAHRAEWERFHRELERAVREERPPLTFGNDGLGLQRIDGVVHGTPSVYPYYNETPRATFLDEVLSYEDAQGRSAASLLRERDIELRLEPGRSLLDQAGITVARVAFRKWDSRGDLLVGLEMNRTQMFSSSADFLLDPLVLPQHDPAPHDPAQPAADTAEPLAAYFVGAYCLEQDVLLKRKIRLDRVPQIGDLVCFPNTAGYMMHFFESEAHLFELAANLIAHPTGDPHAPFRYVPDGLSHRTQVEDSLLSTAPS